MKTARMAHGIQVGREGLEPSRYRYRQILSLLRLPIPPPPRGHNFNRFESRVKEKNEKENHEGPHIFRAGDREGHKGKSKVKNHNWLCKESEEIVQATAKKTIY